MDTRDAVESSTASTPGACELVEHLPFSTHAGIGERARIGLVVLQSDYTIEHEFRGLLTAVQGVEFYVSKVNNDINVTPETLAAMGPRIAEATGRLLMPGDLHVIAYACTSAAVVLGPERVAEYVRQARPGVAVTNPVSAAFAALKHIGAKRVIILTPYTSAVNTQVLDAFCANGFEVPVFGSFNEPNDHTVGCIDAHSLRQAIAALLQRSEQIDAVFVSCTSILMVAVAAELEAEFCLPVISSNIALAWHCLALAGVRAEIEHAGQLLAPKSPLDK